MNMRHCFLLIAISGALRANAVVFADDATGLFHAVDEEVRVLRRASEPEGKRARGSVSVQDEATGMAKKLLHMATQYDRECEARGHRSLSEHRAFTLKTMEKMRGVFEGVRDEKLLYLTILKFREVTPAETTFRSNIMYNVYDDLIMHLCKLRTPRAYHYLLELKKVSSDGRLTFLNEMEASYFRKFRDAKSKK